MTSRPTPPSPRRRRAPRPPRLPSLLLLAALVALPRAAHPQQPPARDTLHLGSLQDAAVRNDPRRAQVELLAAQSELRLRSLEAERLPAFDAHAQAQLQSDVVSIPFELPGGTSIPMPHRDSYDAYLTARQPLYDPTLGARRQVERATLAESQARVRAALFSLRQQVNEAYFAVLLLDAQAAELRGAITDLEAQRRVADERVRGGAALPSEAALLAAEQLRRTQSLAELTAKERAARELLADLSGRELGADDELALPDLGAAVDQARDSLGMRARPEYEQFATSRALLQQRRLAITAGELPRVSAFGRVGYGRPGLNPLADRFDRYWLGGVQVDWAPWRWGSPQRDRATLDIQQRVVATEEASFADQLRRGAIAQLAEIDRLVETLGTDDQILALREEILRETRVRFGEGVITSAEYVDRETDLLTARIARATHRVELARARAAFLTSLGVELR